MPRELERVLAELLRPKRLDAGDGIVERLNALADSALVADHCRTTLAPPESRADFARCNYAEVAP